MDAVDRQEPGTIGEYAQAMNTPLSLNLTAPVSRRAFLKGTGVALALPWLDAMWPARGFAAGNAAPPMRMVCVCTSLGLHAPFLFPKEAGRDYTLTPYLEILKDH